MYGKFFLVCSSKLEISGIYQKAHHFDSDCEVDGFIISDRVDEFVCKFLRRQINHFLWQKIRSIT